MKIAKAIHVNAAVTENILVDVDAFAAMTDHESLEGESLNIL